MHKRAPFAQVLDVHVDGWAVVLVQQAAGRTRHQLVQLCVVVAVVLLTVSASGFKGPTILRIAHHPEISALPKPASGSKAQTNTYGLTAAELASIPRFRPAPVPAPVTVAPGPKAGWFSAIPTTQRVAFITIDDGWVKSPKALPLLEAAHVPVTLFLEINAIRANTGYFVPLRRAGAVIEAHTITHIELKGEPYEVQRHEICGSADKLKQYYGRRPVLFRPPFGDKDATTLRAVHDCGLKAAFFWKETTDKGVVRYQVGHAVRPGDIILMHFRPAFEKDFLAVLHAIARAGLTPALLENYIK